jgi:hypothetical protein
MLPGKAHPVLPEIGEFMVTPVTAAPIVEEPVQDNPTPQFFPADE